jgi:hypothetical protein
MNANRERSVSDMTTTTEYRRRPGRDTWHWMPKCRWWPRVREDAIVAEGRTRPRGELCNECRAKERVSK